MLGIRFLKGTGFLLVELSDTSSVYLYLTTQLPHHQRSTITHWNPELIPKLQVSSSIAVVFLTTSGSDDVPPYQFKLDSP